MSLEANDCHNLLKLKIKAQVCYFLLFLSVFLSKKRILYRPHANIRNLVFSTTINSSITYIL